MVNNVYILDKPQGITSFDAVKHMRSRLGIRRVGHAGTLDPFATGLLIVATGRFTRMTDYFHRYEKTYHTRFRLGVRTDTDDMTGRVLAEDAAGEIREEDVRRFLDGCHGEILQVPPAISAKRVNGQRLYDVNRKNIQQEAKPASVMIHEIKVLDMSMPYVDLSITCGSGTYIRSIARDLGEDLGVGGAVETLRRTRIGPYEITDAQSLETSDIVPLKHVEILPDLDGWTVGLDDLDQLRRGMAVLLKHVQLDDNQLIRVFSHYFRELVMLCRVESVTSVGSRIRPEKVLAVDG